MIEVASIEKARSRRFLDERLSVIMPNYNDSTTIVDALEALCKQSRPPDEIIVIDDGSTDNSVELVERAAKQFPIIRLVKHKRNEGVNRAVNTGIRAATGTVIGFATANDLVYPKFFECGMRLLEEFPHAGLFCADMAIYFSDGTCKETKMLEKSGFYSPEQLAAALNGENLNSPTVLLRRNTFGDYLYEEGLQWNADWWSMTLIAFRHGICYQQENLNRFNTGGWSENMKIASKQSKVTIKLLSLAIENSDVLPLLIKGRAFNVFLYVCGGMELKILGQFLWQQRFYPKALWLAHHILCEKILYDCIHHPYGKYFWKGKLIDIKAFIYKIYFHLYHIFVKIRENIKRRPLNILNWWQK